MPVIRVPARAWRRAAAGALLAARLDQAPGRQALQQRVQHHLLQVGPGHPGPELRPRRMVKARVIQGKSQQVLPVDPGPHRPGRLPVGEILRPLQHGHQRQPRRGPPWLAPGPERGREVLIGQPLSQPLTDQTASGRSVFVAPYMAASPPRPADPAPATQQAAYT
jgi:hypothetical protein